MPAVLIARYKMQVKLRPRMLAIKLTKYLNSGLIFELFFHFFRVLWLKSVYKRVTTVLYYIYRLLYTSIIY